MNPASAIAFVLDHGTPVEQARLHYLVSGTLPSPQVVDALLTGQRPDGGWSPFWVPDYSSLDATCYRLAQAEQLGILHYENAFRQAAAFLAHRQHPDGTWEEDASIAGQAPPWAKPGDLAARLYLTANCGFWLSMLHGSVTQAGLAGDHLESHLGENG